MGKWLVILLAITGTAFSQTKCIPGLTLYKAKVKAKEIDTTIIAGRLVSTDKYIVTSKTRVTLRTGTTPKYKKRKVQVAIFHVPDSSCNFITPIFQHITRYWNDKEQWAKKNAIIKNQDSTSTSFVINDNDTIFFSRPKDGDFSSVSINEGFLKSKCEVIPFIQSEHGNLGAYTIYWYNQNLYKIVLLRSSGIGGLFGFLNQNMKLTRNGEVVQIEGYATRQLEEVYNILKERGKISCE